MNFNLVSDQDNGFRYTAYFGEQIVIPASSKAYLNFASLYRENGVFLEADNTITLTAPAGSVVPTDIWDGAAATANQPITFTKTIEAGRYTVSEIQAKIREAINSMVGTDSGNPNPPPIVTDGRLHLYYSINPVNPLAQSDLMVNLSLNPDITAVDCTQSATDIFNGSIVRNQYQKTGNANAHYPYVFDNYCLSSQHLLFNTYLSTSEEQCSKVRFLTANNNQGSVFLGLYNGSFGGLPNPTAANNTNGAAAPQILTVEWENFVEFDPNAIQYEDQSDQTALAANPNIFAGVGVAPTSNDYYEGFKIEISPTNPPGPGTAFVGYPRLDESAVLPGQDGVMNFVYSGGSLSGLAPTTAITLVQTATSGVGVGFQVVATSNAAGEIGEPEILTATTYIDAPGTGYEQLESMTMLDAGAASPTSISFSIVNTARRGAIDGIYQLPQNFNYISLRDPETAARNMGSGFDPTVQCHIIQEAGGVALDSCTLGEHGVAGAAMIPTCFVGVEVSGIASSTPFQNQVNVYVGVDAVGEFIGSTVTSQDVGLSGMRIVATVDKPLDNRLDFAIKLYTIEGIIGSPSAQFFQVGYYRNDGQTFTVIYDSVRDGLHFNDPYFLKGEPVVSTETQALQNPYQAFFSTQAEFEVIDEAQILPYDPTSNTAGGGSLVPSIIQEMRITTTPELGRVLGYEGAAPYFYPTSDFEDTITQRITDLSVHWANASYYVVIEELPLTNYKNKRENKPDNTGKIKKGMVKNILANIPLPFEALTSGLVQQNDALLIGGLYEPPKKIIVDLKNQEVATNQLAVRLFRMETDLPATELHQSVINFTIIPGGQKLEE
jgi:hypothetical protein